VFLRRWLQPVGECEKKLFKENIKTKKLLSRYYFVYTWGAVM
jgi:hypothetical protein